MRFNIRKRPNASLALLSAALFWGASGIMTQIALTDLGTSSLIFIRFMIASSLALISLFRGGLNWGSFTSLSTWRKGALLSLPLIGVYYASTYALQFTSPAQAAFIASSSVILVPLINFGLFKQALPRHSLLLSSLIFFGLSMIALQGRFHINVNAGILLSLLNALCYALYTALAGRIDKNIDLGLLNFIQYILVALVSGIATWGFQEFPYIMHISSRTILALLGLGILSTYLAFTLQLRSQQFISSDKAMRLLAMIPVFTAIIDVFFGKPPSTYTILGGMIIILAQLINPKEAALLPCASWLRTWQNLHLQGLFQTGGNWWPLRVPQKRTRGMVDDLDRLHSDY